MSDRDRDAYRSYEDYDTTSANYDGSREAVGVPLLLGALAAAGRPLSGQIVLDVGCGTGNYLRELAAHVGCAIGLEYSAGMLAQARRKVGASARVVRGTAFSLPVADGRLDGVLLSQVAHHFDDGGDTAAEFPMLRAALAEAYRALRPGGAVALYHCTRRQVADGYWWMPLIPTGMAAMARRYAPMPVLYEVLADVGFRPAESAALLDAVLQPRGYPDPRAPLDPMWRRGDSTWTLVPDAERESALARIEAMIADGGIDSFLAEREARRREVGQVVFVWARK